MLESTVGHCGPQWFSELTRSMLSMATQDVLWSMAIAENYIGRTFTIIIIHAPKFVIRNPIPPQIILSEGAIVRSSGRAIDRAIGRPSDRGTERSSDRAIERSRVRWSDRAIERSSDRVIGRPSDRANARPNDRATARSKMIMTRAPNSRTSFETLTTALCSIVRNKKI